MKMAKTRMAKSRISPSGPKPLTAPFRPGLGLSPAIILSSLLSAFFLSAFFLSVFFFLAAAPAASAYPDCGTEEMEAEEIYNLGLSHLLAEGVPEDEGKALACFREAAEKGSVAAFERLGQAYRLGYGVEADQVEAASQFSQAAMMGSAEAMYRLVFLYARGFGARGKDPYAAVGYLIEAADKGHYEARELLYLAPGFDKPLPGSDPEAIRLLEEAAEGGDPDAMAALAFNLSYGRGTPQNEKAALEWLTKAANLGHSRSLHVLGRIMSMGFLRGLRLGDPDYPQAVKRYRLAANGGVPEAKMFLGLCLLSGMGAERDREEGIKLMREAARSGDLTSILALAEVLAGSPQLAESPFEAAFWLEKASPSSMRAKFLLGEVLDKGEAVPRDQARAAKLFREAAYDGNRDAQYRLGLMYLSGEGLEKSLPLAEKWLSRAAALGHEKAAEKAAEAF